MAPRSTASSLAILALAPVLHVVCTAQSLRPLTQHTREAILNGQAHYVGRLQAAENMRLVLVLPLRNQEALDNFLNELYDPSSASYHQFLTVGEFTARFGPTQQDYDAVIHYAKANGFQVAGTSRNRMNVDITAPVERIEEAFHITMGVYNHPTENRTFYAPDREPTPDLPVQLWHIAGLDNYSVPQPLLKRKTPGVTTSATVGSGPSGAFLASDMRAAYYGGTTLTGSGQSLGLLEFFGTDLTDLNAYFATIGQTNNVPITLLSTDGTSTNCLAPACDDAEQTLDMTQALGMAPGLASLVVYVGTSDAAIFNAMATANPLNAQLSSSWAWSPADPNTDKPYFQEFAAQGQNLFQATGDGGAWTSKSKIYPADDVFVTAVGGTSLATSSEAGPWSSETAWADGGGGISPDKFAIPSWQTTAASHCSNCSKTLRNSPDVSANADFSFYVCADQTACTANEYGGTSFAAPMWAGYLALVNQQALANTGHSVGFINPSLYTIGLGSSYSTNFHDITNGSNGFPATAGYDLATGWGSPNGIGLINSLAGTSSIPGFYLTVTPSSQQIATGSSATYTLTVNPTGGFAGTVNFSVTGLPAGATVGFNPASVTGSGTTTMTVNAAVGTASGAYTVTVAGSNGSIRQSVDITVAVFTPATAAFVKYDTATQGTWKGVYGANGLAIANDSTAYPSYAEVALNGESNYTWVSSSTDVRALESGLSSSRIASTWYSSGFTIDINLTDGNAHQIAMYAVDWDNLGRAETISVADAASGTVLDTRGISGFANGEWLLWNLTGHVTVTVTQTGNQNAVVSGLFFDVAAPLTPDFAVIATPASQTIGRSASVKYTVTVSPQGGFAGAVALSASGLPSGATATLSPASISGSGSSTLTVTTNSTVAGGSYPIAVTGVSGGLTHSAAVTLAVQVVIPAAAVFVKYDATTEGTWKGVYGSNGWAIANDSTNYPAYAQVALNSESNYTWANSTTDVRALQSGVTNGRIASTWDSSDFTIDINLTDGNTHQVGLYAVDWDNLGLAETISVADATSGTLLDSRSISGFTNGEWLLWNLTGHVKITVIQTGNQNAVVSGLFFDAAGTLTPDFAIIATPSSQTIGRSASANYTVMVSPQGGFAGTVGLSASGLPSGATATFTPASIGGSGNSTLTVTTNNAIAGGSYPITVTGTNGSLTHSTAVTLVVQVVIPAAAVFVKYDSTTEGTWKGVYGSNGLAIANDSTSYPTYAQVALASESNYTWDSSTTDVRALESGLTSTRIASTWYSPSGFTIDINLTDGNTHQVGMYAVDWDNSGRAQTISLADAASGTVLDTRAISAFGNGEWLFWNLTGHVKVTVTNNGG